MLNTTSFSLNTIEELVNFAQQQGTDEHYEIIIGKVSNSQAQEINAITSGKIKSNLAPKILTAHQIRHAFKEHGNDEKERERAQIGITNEDFNLIQEVINNPHKTIRAKDDYNGNPSITFIKTMKKGIYHVVMSLKGKKIRNTGEFESRLEFATLYIWKHNK